ncbi:MAG: hypothetical protein L6R40_000612 [Gallowayella cf. fulva]|nr:MAG: hypothetical protein L6R40_000612 [Xanthomendoza cf. fulva]
MTLSPPTPPSTAPTSPTTSPPSSDGDCVINVGTDPEKDAYNRADSDSSRRPTATNGDISKETFNQKLKQCLPTSLVTGKLPHIPRPWRKEDGREKHIASSTSKSQDLETPTGSQRKSRRSSKGIPEIGSLYE